MQEYTFFTHMIVNTGVMSTSKPFVSLHTLSQQLGLPAAWIKAQAVAGKIPSLRTGRRLMFNQTDVQHVLLKRANSNAARVTDTGKGGGQ